MEVTIIIIICVTVHLSGIPIRFIACNVRVSVCNCLVSRETNREISHRPRVCVCVYYESMSSTPIVSERMCTHRPLYKLCIAFHKLICATDTLWNIVKWRCNPITLSTPSHVRFAWTRERVKRACATNKSGPEIWHLHFKYCIFRV